MLMVTIRTIVTIPTKVTIALLLRAPLPQNTPGLSVFIPVFYKKNAVKWKEILVCVRANRLF